MVNLLHVLCRAFYSLISLSYSFGLQTMHEILECKYVLFYEKRE